MPAVISNSRAQTIARTMATMGFQPKNEFNANFVEYYKDYADDRGHVARVSAIFNRGTFGIDHARLESFVVTTQVHIPALIECVREGVPKVVEPDLMHVLAALGGIDDHEPQAIVQIQCTRCKKSTPEYFMDAKSDSPLCPACFKTKAGASND